MADDRPSRRSERDWPTAWPIAEGRAFRGSGADLPFPPASPSVHDESRR
jgi:hypothetical protein